MRNFIKKLLQKYFTGGSFLILPLVVGTLVSLVTLPIILANLPVAEYGKFQLVLAMQGWLGALSGPHIASGSIRGIATGAEGTFLFAFLARLKLLLIVALIGLSIAAYFYFTGSYLFFCLLTILSVFLVTGYLFQSSYLHFLIARKQFKQIAIWRVTTSVSVSAISALAAYLTHDIVMFALAQLGIVSLVSCLAWLQVVGKNKLIFAYKRDKVDRECLPYGLKLIPTDLVTATSARISHFIVGPFFGFINLAIFSVANKLRDRVADLIINARTLLYSDFAQADRNKLVKIINSRLKLLGAISIIFTLLFMAGGYFYIKLFLPDSYQPAIVYFIILAAAFPANMLGIILHTLLESHLRYKELTPTRIIPALSKIILILIFGYFWQMIGICIAIAVVGWISFILYYFLTLRREKVIGFLNNHSVIKGLVKRY